MISSLPNAGSPTRRLLPHLASLHEGFGSAYERLAIGVLTETLVESLAIRSVAEWPANGVLGVPGLKSMPLAFLGCDVTLLSPSRALLDGAKRIWKAAAAPEPDRVVADPESDDATKSASFDLVWSFCAFEHAKDPNRLARAMVAASRRYVLVFVQNAWMPGVHVHRLHHMYDRRPWDHGSVSIMRAEVVADYLRDAGARVVRLGGCDLPPWPDIDVRLPRLRRPDVAFEERTRPYGPGDPVLSPEAAAAVFERPARLSAAMRLLVRWHDGVETALPADVLRILAHHPYVLAERVR
jgi:hypothetical protein